MKRLLTATTVVVASALLLAGCGGGSGGGDTPPVEQSDAATERAAIDRALSAAYEAVREVDDDSTDAEVKAAKDAIVAARAAIARATNVPEAEKATNSAQVDTLESDLNKAKTARDTAMANAADDKAADMAKTGKALYAALGATPLANNEVAPVLASSGLTINVADGAGALETGTNPDAVELKAGVSAGPLNWAGTNYARTTGTGASKVTSEAAVYTNQGSGKTVPFADRGNVLATETVDTVPAFTAIKDYLTVALGGTIDSGADIAKVMAPAFTHSGIQNHATSSDTGIFTTRGTYDGAPGVYRCTGSCTSTNDDDGSPSELGGTWHFKPDAGANAMAHSPDAEYLYYGWWVHKNSDGDPAAASAFAGTVGTIPPLGNSPDTITGSAKYVGNAAGKWALNNAIDGTGDGGHFTADAELTAKFGAIAAPNNGGVTGTIDNFRLNDGTEDPGWSVELQRAGWDSGAATFGATTAGTTVWSVNGNKADASGAWSGTMYDEMPGNAPDGDGSNIPTTVTGTFHSAFSNNGHMVGAFGAERTEE